MADPEHSPRTVTVAVVDDHPALRAGITALLRPAPGLEFAGAAEGEADLWPLVSRAHPDVVVLDFHLAGRDGLLLCRDLKAQLAPPAVLLYSAFASPSLALAAAVAGADALVGKGVAGAELCHAIRRVAEGDQLLEPPGEDVIAEAEARLEPPDRTVFRLLLRRVPLPEIGAVLGLDGAALRRRVERVLALLRVPVPE